MATATKGKAANVPALPPEDFEAALRAAGFLPTGSGGSDFNRLTVKGTNIVDSSDDIVAAYNQKTKEPALIVQLVGEPRQYQALWFHKDGKLAEAVGRPQIAGKFCKSHFDDETEARDYAEDGTPCRDCPVNPFVPISQLPPEADGKKCQWKADVEFKILEQKDDGTLGTSEEHGDTIFTMTLPTTAVIEFFGSNSKKKGDPLAGSVSPRSTMARLAELGFTKWGKEGILKAKTFYSLGGGIFALHILAASNEDRSRSWNVPSFDPLDILEIEEQPALETTADADVSDDSVPF